MLYKQFLVTKDHMERTCGKSVEVERRLWHGTCKDALNNIYAGGFNRSYCGKNGMSRLSALVKNLLVFTI